MNMAVRLVLAIAAAAGTLLIGRAAYERDQQGRAVRHGSNPTGPT